MTSNPSNLGKSLQPSTSFPPAPQPSAASQSFDSAPRARSCQPSPSHSTPRNGQGSRKQHRNQRRPGQGNNKPNLADDEDSMAEIRAMANASSRRGQTSITHLLNYSVARPHYEYARTYRRQPTWGPGSGYHAIDKARYIHANYRFVVSPEGDYRTQAANADEHIDWSDVLQVIASKESQSTSCPICLSDPVAPRMAKCGHIFCLPCIIRFMNTPIEDEGRDKKQRWRKCPICEDSIYISDVRPVRFYAGQECPLPRPGDDVVLRLMMRHSNSMLALPREGGADVLNSGEDIPWHFAANVLDYARMMKGTGDYMAEQYEEEIAALQKQEKEDELLFGEDSEWTQKAIKAIMTAKETCKELRATEPAKAKASSSRGQHPQCDYFFYTAPPHLYLSPLDIRILKTKYGDFSSFPSTLLPRVEHITTGNVVDQDMRKRARYLGHLPQGCLVSFLECDWTDIIPEEIMSTFAADLEKRRKRNHEKEAVEERERIRAERAELSQIRGMRRNFPAYDNDEPVAPVVNMDDFQPLVSLPGTTPPPTGETGSSHLANMSTSPSGPRTVWGTPAVAGSPTLNPQRPQAPVDDGWLKDDDVLGAAELAMQMESLGMEGAPGAKPQGGGKKKKKQKITLMSTGGRRMG